MKFLMMLLALFFPTVASASMSVWADHGSVKVRQQGDYTGTGQQSVLDISLKCARNEFEPFQVFVYAGGETLTNVNVTVSNLTKGSDTVDDIYIYKEGYVNVTSASRSDYSPGLWPDPLFPKVDRYYHETRNAFPFTVDSGNVQGVWVDLGTTSATPPGTYTGTYTVTADGKAPVTGTVTLSVWDFTLPSTATQKNMWMIQESDLATGFFGAAQSAAWTASMLNLAQTAYLYHRIGLSSKGNSMQFNSVASDGTVTFSANYLTAFGSVMGGTAITAGPYAGARKAVQNIEMANDRAVWDTSSAKWRKYLQSYWDYYQSNGWEPLTRLFAYTQDEPTGATVSYRGSSVTDYQVILAKMSDMNAVVTGGGVWRNTFTTENRKPTGPQSALIDASPSFDTNGVWCPWYGYYEYTDTQGAAFRNARDTYPDYSLWPAKDHWAYHSNMQLIFPNQIDQNNDAPAFWTRAIPWVDWTYRNTGNLYYQTNYLWKSGYEPYVNAKTESENGAANSFYPGVASKSGRTLPASTPEIGGTHDIPIESIKLKLYREGQEDFEYMALLRAQGRTAQADAIVDTIYGSPYSGGHGKYYSLTADTGVIFSARDQLANAIVAVGPAPLPSTICRLGTGGRITGAVK